MGERNGDKHTQKGRKGRCENYRGITLLPTTYKLVANIIKNRLNEHWKTKWHRNSVALERNTVVLILYSRCNR
jgi:hypothetical protein